MNKKEIIEKVKELFAVGTKVKMEKISVTLLKPVEFDIEDGEELIDGLEVSIEDGSYSLDDGSTFEVKDGKVENFVSNEIVVEGEDGKEEKPDEVEMTNVEVKTDELDDLKKIVNNLKKTVETMDAENIEMSAKIVELSNQPAEKTKIVEKAIFSKQEKYDRLTAIRNAMQN